MGLLGDDRPNVSKLARKGKVDALRDALRYEEVFADDDGRDWDVGVPVRVEAARALSQFDAAAVAGDLTAALGDRAAAVRLAAVQSLGGLSTGAAGAVEPLVECVASRRPGDEEVAAAALEVLAARQSHGTADLLVDRLLDPAGPELDDAHREALDRLLDADSRGAPARSSAIDRLLAQLGSPAGDAGGRAELILGWLGSAAREKVIDALENDSASPGVMRVAGQLGDARAVAPVVRALESDDPDMRQAAASAARGLNHTRAVPALLSATQDDHQAVRDAASSALDRMGTAAVIAGLAAVVSARDLLDGLSASDGDGLLDADGPGELLEGEPVDAEPAEAETQAGPAAPARPTASGYSQPAAPAHPVPPRQRRGGFLDRLLGPRDY